MVKKFDLCLRLFLLLILMAKIESKNLEIHRIMLPLMGEKNPSQNLLNDVMSSNKRASLKSNCTNISLSDNSSSARLRNIILNKYEISLKHLNHSSSNSKEKTLQKPYLKVTFNPEIHNLSTSVSIKRDSSVFENHHLNLNKILNRKKKRETKNINKRMKGFNDDRVFKSNLSLITESTIRKSDLTKTAYMDLIRSIIKREMTEEDQLMRNNSFDNLENSQKKFNQLSTIKRSNNIHNINENHSEDSNYDIKMRIKRNEKNNRKLNVRRLEKIRSNENVLFKTNGPEQVRKNKNMERNEEMRDLIKQLVIKVTELNDFLNSGGLKESKRYKKKTYSNSIIPSKEENPNFIVEKCVSIANGKIPIIRKSNDYKRSSTNKNSDVRNVVDGGRKKDRRKRKLHRKWDRWTDWSSCSVTCGRGRQIRWRHCLRYCNTAETEMEEKTCQLPACPPSKLFGLF